MQFVNLTLTGLSLGLIYASIAVSLVLIWRATRTLNFAGGAMLMLTTFIGVEVLDATGSYVLALVVSVACGAVLGLAVYFGLIARIKKNRGFNTIIITLALLTLLQAVAGMVWGSNPRPYPFALSAEGMAIGDTHLAFSTSDLLVFAVIGSLMVGLVLLFMKTSLGIRMRAAAFMPETSSLLGVHVNRLYALAWAMAGAAGSLAGVFVAPTMFVAPTSFDTLIIFGFTGAVIGGLDNPIGAMVGGLLVGLVTSYVAGYVAPPLTAVGALAVLVLVLLWLPEGLFGHAESRAV